MTSFRKLIAIATVALTTTAVSATNSALLHPTTGVAAELAEVRRAAYSDIRYTLYFDVPSDKNLAIKGRVDIEYTTTTARYQGIVDFRGDSNQILRVAVNRHTTTDYAFVNEHIVIPPELLISSRNIVTIEFIANDKPINRNDEFVYTLLVPDRARTLFPCFDQPDLKATYSLTLDVDSTWIALSNTSIKHESLTPAGRRHIIFCDTEPLSTYLFSFVAGKFSRDQRSRNGHTIAAYYRETDPDKTSQLDTIFGQVFDALEWQEAYTAIKYPFAKYDFVILPGFQFGGMEHTGATLYNDRLMFLGNHPTPDEELGRAQLIAHETSHMWFGDLVTMKWFDDVWTKEVFANYYAAVITEPIFSNYNHTLNRLSSFYVPSLNQDRTLGSTAIQQPLDNMEDAGLIYNNIIYNKAPVVMFKIAEMMGEDAFRDGVRKYLTRYAYANATWDDLIECLDSRCDTDLKQFSDVWIKAKGMPEIRVIADSLGFTVKQVDPFGRGLVWPQTFTVKVFADGREPTTVTINLNEHERHFTTGFRPKALIPNSDGRGYGYFSTDSSSLKLMANTLTEMSDGVERMVALMTLFEEYLHHGHVTPTMMAETLLRGALHEENALIASMIVDDLDFVCSHTYGSSRQQLEIAMNNLTEMMPVVSARLKLQRKLRAIMTDHDVVTKFHDIWIAESSPLWNENDYTETAYQLALRLPEQCDSILSRQRCRITNPDRLQQFDYISRACTSDTTRLDSLFDSLRNPNDRRIEPYAESLLNYLNHPLRDSYSSRYIEPGLEMLEEIQHTGDIFFPTKWAQKLLGDHRSPEAIAALKRFIARHPDYPPSLMSKILQAAYPVVWGYDD